MLTPEKLKSLQAFLSRLPPLMAQRLTLAVELDRLNNGTLFPHDLIMESLRPSLRQAVNPDRLLSPQRLFCAPFEDLLSSSPRQQKQKGRIARDSATAMWRWLNDALLPDATAAFVDAATSAVLHHDIDAAKASAGSFYRVAADAISAALANEAAREQARIALNGELAVADAAEMVLLLRAAPFVRDIQDKLPRAAPQLTDDLIWDLRSIYDRMVQALPDAAPYVTVIAMNRLAKPWEALKLPLMIARKTQDTLISSTDMGLAGELLLLDIADLARAIHAIRPPQFETDILLSQLARFTELSTAIVKEVEIRRDGRWGRNLFKDRALVSEAMGEIMKRTPEEIEAALPMHRSGAFGSGPRVPDLARAPDPERAERALRHATLLMGCRHLAAAASFHALHQDALEETMRHLSAFNDGIVAEMSNVERRSRAEAFFDTAARLTAILFSEEEAEHMRRRARAALAA